MCYKGVGLKCKPQYATHPAKPEECEAPYGLAYHRDESRTILAVGFRDFPALGLYPVVQCLPDAESLCAPTSTAPGAHHALAPWLKPPYTSRARVEVPAFSELILD